MSNAAEEEIIDAEVVEPPKRTELVPVPKTASALDLPTEEFRAALDRRGANRRALLDWIRDSLVGGEDYGKIHYVSKNKCRLFAETGNCDNPDHYSKNCLFKAGAEKICGMLGVQAIFPNTKEYEKMAVEGIKVVTIILRCELYDSNGRLVGEGAGARLIDKDYGDINKSLKMAQKSAQIDATLRMAGLSEIFTQDIEDSTQCALEGMSASRGSHQAVQSKDIEAAMQELRTNPRYEGGLETAQVKAIFKMKPRSGKSLVFIIDGKNVVFPVAHVKSYGRGSIEISAWIADKKIEEGAISPELVSYNTDPGGPEMDEPPPPDTTTDSKPFKKIVENPVTDEALTVLREAALNSCQAENDEDLLYIVRSYTGIMDLPSLNHMNMDEYKIALEKIDKHGVSAAKQASLKEKPGG